MFRKPNLDPLADLQIASPCSARWEDMTGDDEVRFCGLCNLHVFNLSAMNRQEAAVLLAADSNSMCLQYYRRADGAVLTKDCPVGASAREQKRIGGRRKAGKAMLGVGVAAVGAAVFWPVQTMGRVAGPVGQSVGLRMAAGSGNLEAMRHYLDVGIDPNTASSSGMTPLMDAAMNGQTDAVRLLLERGADPALQLDSGTTALDLARNADAQKIIRLLKAHLWQKTSSH